MQKYFAAIRRVTLTGLLFLVPVYVVLVIAKQVWTQLSSLGTTLARVLGLADMGVAAPTVLSVLLLGVLCFVCGFIAHVSIVAALRARMDAWLTAYIPGYAKHRVMVETKIDGKVPTLPYASALIRQQDFWRPVYVIEQDAEGNCVVFVPSVPDTSTGSVLIARGQDIQMLPALSANELDASLKKRGAGLSSAMTAGRWLAEGSGTRVEARVPLVSAES